MFMPRLGQMALKFQSWVALFIYLVYAAAWFLTLSGRTPRRESAVILCMPLPFMAQAFFFTPGTGEPPRHLVASHLVLWLSGLFTLTFLEGPVDVTSRLPAREIDPKASAGVVIFEKPASVAETREEPTTKAGPISDDDEQGFIRFLAAGALLAVPVILLPALLKDVTWVYPTYGPSNRHFELFAIFGSLWIIAILGAWAKRRPGEALARYAPVIAGGLVMFQFLSLVSEYSWPSYDYSCYRLGAERLLEGASPYGRGYLYPPLAAQLFAVVFTCVGKIGGAGVSQETVWKGVFYLYQTAQYFCIVLSFFLCHRLSRRMGAAEPWASVLVAALFLCNNPLLRVFRHQQVNLFLAAAGLICFLFGRRFAFTAGLALAVAVHIKLYPALLVLPLAMVGWWPTVGWTIAGIAGLFGVTLTLPGSTGVWGHFVAYMQHPLLGTALRDNSIHSIVFNIAKRLPQSLGGLFPPYGPWVTRVAFFISACILFGLLIRWRRRARQADERAPLQIGAEALAAILLVSPVAWEHYYVLAVPLAVCALSTIPPFSSPGRLFAVGAMLFIPTFDFFPFSYFRIAALLWLIFQIHGESSDPGQKPEGL